MRNLLPTSILSLLGVVVSIVILFTSCGDPTPASNEILYKTSLEGKWKTLIFDEKITAMRKSEGGEICDTIVAMILPNSVERIDVEAFKNFVSLTSIKLPKKLTDIGHRAFEGCKSLKSINIPKGVNGIGYKVFEGCSSLPVIDGVIYADSYLVGVTDSTRVSYNIKKGTRFIGNDAFKNCESMTSIILPKGLVMIGIEAFYCCKKLSSIILPEGITMIGEGAFAGCWDLASINIPESVQFVGNDIFYGCSSLPVIDGVVYADTYLVECKTKIDFKNIKSGTRFIANDAFYGNSFGYRYGFSEDDGYNGFGIESIIIPESVEQIGDRAFRNCRHLTSVTIPEGVKTIGDEAFYGCERMHTVTIPSSVTSIGKMAFGECKELTTVQCKATTPPELPSSLIFVYYYSEMEQYYDDFFERYNRLKKTGYYTLSKLKAIYVPKESVDAYKNAHGWNKYSEIKSYDFDLN